MRKLFIVLSMICVTALSVSAFDFVQLHRPKSKRPLPQTAIEKEKVVRPMPKVDNKSTKKERTLSWIKYLRNLQLVASEFSSYDFESNIHDYLLAINPREVTDQEMAFSLKDYQEISRYFQEVYHVDPTQGTLEQYKEFYLAFNNLTPREYNLLPTIAIWSTGSVEAILPFRHQMRSYWQTPELAAKAYDAMATIAPSDTLNKFNQYMRFSVGSVETEENQEEIKNFFAVWKNNTDQDLPSVKDAAHFEALVLQMP